MRNVDGRAAVARVFLRQPERIAAAWRRVRRAQGTGALDDPSFIDDLVEPFVREVGQALLGTPGSPWSRTRGVLRLSPSRGARSLYDAFTALRRCMTDALEALDGGSEERRILSAALDEALDSAVALCQRLRDPRAEPPPVPFGGVVVELYEAAPLHRPKTEGVAPALH